MGLKKILAGTVLAFSLCTAQLYAQPAKIIHVNINSAEYLDVGFKIKRIATGNSSIAVIKKVGNSLNEILIEGHGAGTTSLLIWHDETKPPLNYQIIVSPEDLGQAALIEEAINLPNVHVKMMGGRILLTGSVKNQYEHNYVLQMVSLYIGDTGNLRANTGSGENLNLDTQSSTSSSSSDVETSELSSSGNVIDLLQILNPTQISLEAIILDINSDAAKDLGLRWGTEGATAPGVFSMGESVVARGSTPFRNNPIRWAEQHFSAINSTINALVSKGKARILSRPNITTLAGEQATIQIGGQIPYTVFSASTGIASTNFKDYGVILQFQSTVDTRNKITAVVHAEVSNLSGQSVDGQPIIATRRADSVVNLADGATMIIGGLMDSSESKSVSGIPLLSKIPIIGEFFKYTTKSKNKRELMILITPHIVEDVSTAPMSQDMKDFYTEEFNNRKNLEDVNLNNPARNETENETYYEDEADVEIDIEKIFPAEEAD